MGISLLEEDSAGAWPVQNLSERELGLEDGHIIAVAGGAVLSRERVGQTGQPLAQQGVDLRRRQSVRDFLHPRGIGAREDAVVEGLEGDAFLGQLLLEVFVIKMSDSLYIILFYIILTT